MAIREVARSKAGVGVLAINVRRRFEDGMSIDL